jgi:glycosyltransferase involved in cell wall biosynthesis
MPVAPKENKLSPPKRVLLFDHTAQLGGGELALLDLVRFFDRRRVWPIVLLGSNGPLADRIREIAEVHILEISSDVLHTRKDSIGTSSVLRLKTAVDVFSYVLRLIEFIHVHDIELIHTNSLKADILGGIAGKITQTPVVWHMRDRITDDYLPRPAVQAMRKLCKSIPDFIIGNSAATIETLDLQGACPSMAVASGVDIRFYEQADTSLALAASYSKRGACVGLIGRICPWKGQHIFLRAAAEVLRRFPKAHFQIIGAALFKEQQYELEMHELARTLGIERSVEFTGFRNDVPDLIRGLDLIVHASTTGEPFGQVIVQGMAAGKPVVATNGGGVPEIVVDGTTGLLVPMDDAPALGAAICKLLAAPETAAAMGKAGRKRVLEHFTIEQSARKVEAVYAEVLAREPAF